MAQYDINFSTNASQIAKELSKVQTALAKTVQTAKPGGLKIKLSLDTADFTRAINSSFKELDRLISEAEKKLRKAKIGSPEFKLAAAQSGQLRGESQRGQMMARAIGSRESAQAFDVGSLARYERALESLRIQAELIAPNTKEWVNLQQKIGEITLELRQADKAAESIQLTQQLGALAPGSLSRLEKQLTILKTKAREIAPDTLEWKKLNKEIQNVERSIQKVSKKPLSAGQRAGAAGGAFLYGGGMGGGVGSAVGGIAGGLAGGVPGAFAGAAIGQVADNLGTALAGITSQAAAVQKMQRGLAMASVDAKDFAEAQAAVGEMSQKLLMPLEQTTKYFAQLRANTKEYNLSVADTKQILEGTALAIMATGGSAEDLDGAMRAVVQIMSKGGVQAEELRGQLGERFPGAVVKFAQANKLSFEELQAGLEAGTIGIREFINFAEKNYTDYAKFSEQLATAPEYAGQRLKMALEQISIEVGSLFGPMGSEIQDGFTQALKGIAEFVKENRAILKQMIQDFGSIVVPIVKVFGDLLKVLGVFAFEVAKVFTSLFQTIKSAIGMASIGSAKARLDKAKAATAGKTRPKPAREDSVIDIVMGRTILRETKDLLGVGNEFEELDAAQRQFNNLGGMAAYNKANQPVGPSNLTLGGAGAGMSIDRTGKDEEGKNKDKNKKLQEFTNDRIKTLQRRQEAESLDVDNQLLVSDRERELAKAAIDFRYGNLIIDEQLAQAEKDSLRYRVEDRERFLAEIQTLAGIERDVVKTRQDITVAGPLVSEYQRLIATQDDLKLSLESVLSGQGELTESQKLAALISKTFAAATDEQIAKLDDLTKAAIAAAGGIDKYLIAISYATTMKGLQNQLDLARILDPRAERRAQIKQEKPELSDVQIENQAALEEQVAAATKARDQLRSIASSIGDAFGNAFKGIITGSMTVQQALAGMFQSIADSFADMAAQMIAEYVRMQALGLLKTIFSAVAPAIGGGLSSGFGAGTSSAIDTGAGGWADSFGTSLKFANGGIASGGFTAFANGGMVTGPTLGLVGEGRYNEAIIPLPDGKSVPVQLSGGVGGNAAPINTNIVVNVKNGQAESQMSGNQGNQLARELEGAVRQVILKESRPGGLISSSR
jgi:tape measure domain-containing protein